MKAKRIMISCLILIFLTLFAATSLAEKISPYASEIFFSYSITLYSDKTADFQCCTYPVCSSIKVSSCVLQEKETSLLGKVTWNDVKSLSVPGSQSNVSVYANVKDYSSDIGKGTFRLKVTFTAEGESQTVYSNTKTFSK